MAQVVLSPYVHPIVCNFIYRRKNEVTGSSHARKIRLHWRYKEPSWIPLQAKLSEDLRGLIKEKQK